MTCILYKKCTVIPLTCCTVYDSNIGECEKNCLLNFSASFLQPILLDEALACRKMGQHLFIPSNLVYEYSVRLKRSWT